MKYTIVLLAAITLAYIAGASSCYAEGAEPDPRPFCDEISRKEGVCG